MSETNDITVTFRGFEGEQDHARLTDYLIDFLGATVSSFLPAEPYHLDLKVHHERLHNNQKNHRFECEAVVRIEGDRVPIVVRKTDANFYTAAHVCEAAIRKILTQRTRMREKVRRQPRFNPAPL